MSRFRSWVLLCAMALLVFSGSPMVAEVPANGSVIKVGGTGSALGGMKLLAKAFEEENPGIRIEVLPSLGSGGGIKAVLAGAIDLAVAARPAKEMEKAAGAASQAYAVTPVVLATAVSTSVDGLSLEQMASFYVGREMKWSDGRQVRLILRPDSETDTKLLRKFSPAMDEAVQKAQKRPGMLVAFNDQENADALERLEGSLGTATLGQIRTEERKLKVLAIDGVEPTAELVASGGYELTKTLHVVTSAQTGEAAQRFAAFVRSPAGRAILSETGHVPAD